MDFKVFCTRIMREEGINLLKQHIKNVEVWPENRPCPRDVLLAKAGEVDALLTQMGDKIDAEVINHPNLKVISQIAVGTDNIDLKAAAARKLPVSHTPGVLTEACADHAWALMLCAARQLVQSNRYVVGGEWTQQDPMAFLGNDVYGKTLGIIGPGRIGQAIGRRASGFSMRVIYYGPHEKPEFANATRVSLDELMSESDYVVLSCPLNDGTRGIVGEAQLKKMKKDAILVNIARGPCVVTDDLVKALKEGWIGAAALDVTDPEPLPAEHPLNKLPNCVVFSHIASATVPTRANMSLISAQAIIDALSGKRVQFCANPDAYN